MLISEKSPLVFIHVPKTGGISMFVTFCQLWGERIADLYNCTSANPSEAGKLLKNEQISLYCGHYSFGMHEWLDRPSYYVSVVRHPVRRIQSLYYFSLQFRHVIRQRMLQNKEMPFSGWFDQGHFPDFYKDYESWILDKECMDRFFASNSAELDNGMVRRFSGLGLSATPCSKYDLERAKENIERHFSAVGVTERYADTLKLFSRVLQLPELQEHQFNLGDKSRDAELPACVLAQIEAMNPLDLELYDWVCARLDAQLQALPSAIANPAGGRSDYINLPLWHAVGQSPLREAAMKAGGPPQIPYYSSTSQRVEQP